MSPAAVVEIVKLLVLAVVGLFLLRLIKRHGREYAEQAFGGTEASKSFLALADIAYYLIVGSFLLVNVSIEFF